MGERYNKQFTAWLPAPPFARPLGREILASLSLSLRKAGRQSESSSSDGPCVMAAAAAAAAAPLISYLIYCPRT